MAAPAKDVELPDYEDEIIDETLESKESAAAPDKKGHYSGIHSSNFRDFLLKPEVLRAVVDCGFEHPSQVQQECIPQALLGMDIICQAKSGMGKTAVFVLTTLNQLEPEEGKVSVVVMCHARELAYQIGAEYNRFSKYLPGVTTTVLYGGVPIKTHLELLKTKPPNIIVATPGRLFDLIERKAVDLSGVSYFVLDECDKMLEEAKMRSMVQQVFMKTPHDKQVMMFSATLSDAIRPVCRKFCSTPEPLEILINKEKLRLHGLQQYIVRLKPEEKNRKLSELLDALEFNQVVIFVSKVVRARELDRLLRECNFPSTYVVGAMKQEDRLAAYNAFKENKSRILVSTDVMGRGIDIEHVNVVINYDFPQVDERTKADPADSYLHRVARAGRFGTKGLAISFISSAEDEKVLDSVQSRFALSIPDIPDVIDPKTYIE